MVTRIMVAEDNEEIFEYYKNIFSKCTNVDIIAYTKDGESTIEMYKKFKPDVLFLDLGLPKINGLDIINTLSEYEGTESKCNIVVISGDAYLRHSLYNTKKVYRIIPKPASDELLNNTIQSIQKDLIMDEFPKEKWNDTLRRLNINPYLKSSKLLTDIIKLTYCDVDLLDNMQQIYIMMSLRYSCSPSKIQSRLRSCIDTANRLSTKKSFNLIFDIDDYNDNMLISPKHFISGIITYLKK